MGAVEKAPGWLPAPWLSGGLRPALGAPAEPPVHNAWTGTFQHLHGHGCVPCFAFQPEGCCLNHFSKFAFSQSFPKNQVLPREFPLWILLCGVGGRRRREGRKLVRVRGKEDDKAHKRAPSGEAPVLSNGHLNRWATGTHLH